MFARSLIRVERIWYTLCSLSLFVVDECATYSWPAELDIFQCNWSIKSQVWIVSVAWYSRRSVNIQSSSKCFGRPNWWTSMCCFRNYIQTKLVNTHLFNSHFPGKSRLAGFPQTLSLRWSLIPYWESSREKPELYISPLTQSHRVFFGYHLFTGKTCKIKSYLLQRCVIIDRKNSVLTENLKRCCTIKIKNLYNDNVNKLMFWP